MERGREEALEAWIGAGGDEERREGGGGDDAWTGQRVSSR